jgi:hypothetical protein
MYSTEQATPAASDSETLSEEEKQYQERRQQLAQAAYEKIKTTNFMQDASVGLVWKYDRCPEAVQLMADEEEVEFLEDTSLCEIWLAYLPYKWLSDSYIAWVQNNIADETGCVSITDRQLSRERLLSEYKPKDEPILVWEYKNTPTEIQALANSGGDEDWVAWVPKALSGDYIQWLQDGYFGCCKVRTMDLPDGSYIAVGQHA